MEANTDYVRRKKITMNTTTAQEAVPAAERVIRFIKERMCAVTRIFPFRLPVTLVQFLSRCVFNIINIKCGTESSSEEVSPREIVPGREVDAKKDLYLAFEDYMLLHKAKIERSMN